MIRKKAYDYVVVGGGFAGLNAVAGLQKFRPGASILCVDKRPGPADRAVAARTCPQLTAYYTARYPKL